METCIPATTRVRRQALHGRGGRAMAAGAAVVAVAGWGVAASACTAIMGDLVISPQSGPAGTGITTSATGVKTYPAKYRLLYAPPGGECMTSRKVLVASIATSRGGTWTGVHATIPATAPRGTSTVCGMENSPVRNQTGTTHISFTVV